MIALHSSSQSILDSLSNGSVITVSGTPFAVYDSTQVEGFAEDYITCEECMELKDTLTSIVHVQQQRLNLKDSIISLMNDQNSTRDGIIQIYQAKSVNDQNYISNLKYDLKAAKTKSTIFGTIGGVVLIGLITGLTYSLIHH